MSLPACKIDHGALPASMRFCPSCGRSVMPVREPGEIRAKIKEFANVTRNDMKWDNPFIGAAMMVTCIETLKWCLGEITNERLKLIVTDPKTLAERGEI